MMKCIATYCLLWFLYPVIWTEVVQFTKYKMEKLTCNIVYGHTIRTVKTYSEGLCGIKCKSQIGCRSVLYEILTKKCKMNNGTKETNKVVQGGCGRQITYLEKESLSYTCVSNLDCGAIRCTIENTCTTCKLKLCQCWKLYWYNVHNDTCQRDCGTYDDKFRYFLDASEDFRDYAMISNVSAADCLSTCLSETEFQCLWYSYNPETQICTYKPDILTTFSKGSNKIYKRYCADY